MRLPLAFSDETLFSRFVRQITVHGVKEEVFLYELFQKSRTSIHPYLTAGIKRVSLTSGESETKIFNEQTLGGLFSYFLPDYAKSIYSTMLSNDCNAAVRACQLTNFKESETLSIKYCPLCAQNDIEQNGVSYWHRVHQIPGIEVCPHHQVWLIHQALPERPHLKSGLLPRSDSTPHQSSLLAFHFAQYAQAFLDKITYTEGSFNQKELISQLKALGYTTEKNRFRRKKLTSDFYQFVTDLQYPFSKFLPRSEEDYKYLSYLLSGQVSQHPFKYLLTAFWLSRIPKTHSEEPYSELKNTSSRPNKQLKEKCAQLLRQGNSLAKVSRMTGKSRCFLKLLAMQENIPINTKPYLLNNMTRMNIIAMARKGFHRRTIAHHFQISMGSVEQIISSVKGLVNERKRYKLESKARRYKAQILRALQQHPNTIKQEIKQLCYAAFHWLYIHDKKWLNNALPTPTKPQHYSSVNWKERDLELASKVNDLVLNYSGLISLSQLDKKLGGHGWLIKMKHKLPLTMKIIQNFKTTPSKY